MCKPECKPVAIDVDQVARDWGSAHAGSFKVSKAIADIHGLLEVIRAQQELLKIYERADTELVDAVLRVVSDFGVNVVLDGIVFAEIEDDNGRSVRIGTHRKCDDGFNRIRITVGEICEMVKAAKAAEIADEVTQEVPLP